MDNRDIVAKAARYMVNAYGNDAEFRAVRRVNDLMKIEPTAAVLWNQVVASIRLRKAA
jgi:hypothetical protein